MGGLPAVRLKGVKSGRMQADQLKHLRQFNGESAIIKEPNTMFDPTGKEPPCIMKKRNLFPFCWRDLALTALTLVCAIGFCALLRCADSNNDAYAYPIFLLAVLLVSRITSGYLFGLITAVLGVVGVNYIFTFPYLAFDFTLSGYPLTFLTYLAVSVITSTLTSQIKQQEHLRIETEREKLRANLLRSVSHDIRTPLTSIMGATSAILDNPGLSEEEKRELLTDARDEAQWLIRVVENLLSVTRIGNDQGKVAAELEAAEEVLAETVQKFRKRFPNMKVHVTAPEELLMVPMDVILIEQVLSNLLENAVFHGVSTSLITVSVEREGDYAKFSVRDNGRGIAPDRMANLFRSQLPQGELSSSDGKRNMGLGLAVCEAVVRAHNGTMNARNLKEGGAEFFFLLPLSTTEEPA